jgi:hypothetical protein
MVKEQEFNELKRKVEELERILRSHAHRGYDNTPKIELGDTDISAKTLTLVGGLSPNNQYTGYLLPLSVVDNPRDKKIGGTNIVELGEKQRGTAFGIGVIGRTTLKEQINSAIVAGIASNNPNEEQNQAQIRLVYERYSSAQPPYGFFVGQRTPLILSSGTLTNGGNTLTDSSLNVKNNSLVGCPIYIFDNSGDISEARIISSNISNTITINGTWSSPSGTYNYYVFSPLLLGSAESPWGRLYVADRNNDRKAIRLGYGKSTGSQVIWICYGSGSPEGVVTANVGSIYLRTDGGAGSTLYVKQSGNGTPNGWVAK